MDSISQTTPPVMNSEQYSEYISDLDEILSRRPEELEMGPWFDDLLKHKPIPIRRNNPISIPIYRAAYLDDPAKANNIQRFSYCPESVCKRDGRAHIAGHPVFYGSLGVHTAINEVLKTDKGLPSEGHIYVSKWWPLRPLNLVQYLYDPAKIQSELYASFNSTAENKLKELTSTYPDLGEALIRINRAVGSLFVQPGYFFSSRLAHSSIYQDSGRLKDLIPVHGIVFPSIVKQHTDLNFALHPETVDTLLKPTFVFEYRFRNNTLDGADVTIVGTGLVGKNDEIIWYDVANSSQGTHIAQLILAPANERPVRVDLDAEVTHNGEVITARQLAHIAFAGRVPDLTRNLGVIDYDFEPGITITGDFHLGIPHPVYYGTADSRIEASELFVQLALRPVFRLRE